MDKFSPLLNIRRSFKRDQLTKLASEHASPHRSLSTKRLPFSTIKSAAQSDRKYLNDSLPNSPKQLSDSFSRFNYKTSSFHYCKRYSSKDDDNVGLFLEALENSIKSINEKKLNFFKEIEDESTNTKIQDEKHFSFYSNEPWLNISKEKKEQLYCEIIYTIKHKIGRTIDGHTDFIADLYKYAQQAFKMTAEDHERLFQLASEEKAPILILNCEVLEACDLEAKDANGFSDPYCMLGIVPGNRKNSINQQSDTFTHGLSKMPTVQNFNINQSGQHSQSSHQKSSLIKRFSSFRRSEKSHPTAQALNFSKDSNLNKNKSSPNTNLKLTGISEKLPAKYIQTTNVKKATLNPVWKEEFRFQIDDIKTDTLHLDIWDHDDESSVFEAAKKLNEVRGLKGLDRYFKQIAQSARTNKEETVDDFLGSINIRLDDLPSSGVEKWFELEGRSEKSKVEGKIKLRLNFSTKEDRGDREENDTNEISQHETIIRLFIQHELKKPSVEKSSEWKGELSREAETILHQHCIQGDMNEFQIALSQWIAYSKFHLDKELSYQLLMQKLENLDKVWDSSSLLREESESLKESFKLLVKHCFKLISNIREVFPITENRLGLQKLESVLRILNKIFNLNAFKYCLPFQNSLIHELSSVIRNASADWIDKNATSFFRKSEDDNLKKLIELCHTVYLDLLTAQRFYDPIFKNETNIDYFTILYKKIDLILINLIEKVLVEEFGEDIKKFPSQVISKYGQSSMNSPDLTKDNENGLTKGNLNSILNYVTITEQISINLFELYSVVFIIFRMKSNLIESDQLSLNILKFYELFYMPYKRWIDLIKKRVDNKIDKCFDSEKNDVLTELTKVSSSSIEISNLLSHTNRIWKLIHWPDFVGSQMFFIEIVDSLSKAIIKYASQIKESNAKAQNFQCNANFNPNQSKSYQKCGSELDYFQRLVITANNLDKVRDTFRAFYHDLEFDKYQSQAEKQDRLQLFEINKAHLEVVVSNTCEALVQALEQSLEMIVANKILRELDQHMFYLFESPESASAKESITRLIEYLNSSFRIYQPIAFKSNFNLFLKIQWIKLLDQIECDLDKDKSRSPVFFAKMYECLDILVDFFSSENQGLEADFLQSVEKFKQLRKYLNYSRMDTQKLIITYYQEMIEYQNSQRFCDNGKLICRACYHSRDEILAIEILKCKNLLPMDQNGLSDPYVEIDLKPKHVFVNCEKKSTTVVKKSLNPTYNETFEFKLAERYLSQPGHVIHFTIMDHDIVWTNDFEGEAFLELNSVPRLKGESSDINYKELKYSELMLIRPKDIPSRIIDVLEYRKDQDKTALEFLKERRDKLYI